jgi:hypothetical protein
MKGEFSRSSYTRGKYYRVVLLQQGRVALDADSNERDVIVLREARLMPPPAQLRGVRPKR